MADTGSSIFNKQAVERLRSPDDLDRYVRVTNPSVWALLFAVVFVTVGLLAWGVFGSVSTGVTATGSSVGGKVYCMLDGEQASKVHVGDPVHVDGHRGTVLSVSDTPVSPAEASGIFQSDYLVDVVMPGEWGYLVTLDGVEVEKENVPVTVNITTSTVAPLSLVLGGTH